ncbi:hypothetical protein SmJEL517_g05982 [Synchytrium microbalum]|uniref:RRM domain-containing protein n=1 Tax=Synchytrium microbalum TaxID=1806994 RepID=A0A507BSV3_9FUNG|nr:uncharacterized protein SmJEL517_g05982 [Synchytrium microbalum]TPX30458.1 hypothetical protein SmJEL517_g05982 [Synchytrium microbalum]
MASMDLDMSLDEIMAGNKKPSGRGRGGSRGRGRGSSNNNYNNRNDNNNGFKRGGGGKMTIDNGRFHTSRKTPYPRRGGNNSNHRHTPAGNVDGNWRHDLFSNAAGGDGDDNDMDDGAATTSITTGHGGRRFDMIVSGNLPPAPQQRKRNNDKADYGEYPGPSVQVTNIHWNVSEQDLLELCQFKNPGCEVVDLKLHYDNAGRSEGIADVTFASNEDADICVQEWNGLAIDDQYLECKLNNPPPNRPVAQRLGIQGRLGPSKGGKGSQANDKNSNILSRLGPRVSGRGGGGGRGAGRGGKKHADEAFAAGFSSRTVLNYGDAAHPPHG